MNLDNYLLINNTIDIIKVSPYGMITVRCENGSSVERGLKEGEKLEIQEMHQPLMTMMNLNGKIEIETLFEVSTLRDMRDDTVFICF